MKKKAELKYLRCNSTYRLRYWNATRIVLIDIIIYLLQQYLPFTVLKLTDYLICLISVICSVATVLTVYGIETGVDLRRNFRLRCFFVATVLTVYGIETMRSHRVRPSGLLCCNSTYRLRYWNLLSHRDVLDHRHRTVATVLTVYGIETQYQYHRMSLVYKLQQYLPFTVLKPSVSTK